MSIVIGAMALILVFSATVHADDPTETLYGFQKWAGYTKLQYERTVTNWVPDLVSLGATNVLLFDEGVWTNSQKFSDYIFETSQFPALNVRLRVWECQDVTNAQKSMLNHFAASAAPQPFPLGNSLGVDIGDRCYLSWGAVDSVSFVRNNVFVFVVGASATIPLAEKLDCELVRHSFSGPVVLQPGIGDGAFHVFVPTTTTNTYILESNGSPSGTNWTGFPPFTGDGTIRLITYPAFSDEQFFRLRVQ